MLPTLRPSTHLPANHWLDERDPYAVLTTRGLCLTIALSCLVHLSALFLWPAKMSPFGPTGEEREQPSDRLQVRLAAIHPPASASPAPTPALPARPLPPPRVQPRTQPLPVVKLPAPVAPILATPAPPIEPLAPGPAARPTPPVEGDLWSYVQTRRRARGEQVSAAEQSRSEPNTVLAANLPSPAAGTATRDKRGGGIFEIKRLNYDDAAFEFFGWNSEMGRNTPQLIEVRRGNNSDMRVAVVRRMIAIIRVYSQGDFVWRSPRHEDGIVLSARPSDNAALENFLMHDFFDEPRRIH